MFKWYRATEVNCAATDLSWPRPCFAPELVGAVDMLAQVAFVLGLILYNRYMSHLSYRRIFVLVHIGLTAVNLLDFVWVCRINRWLGVRHSEPNYTPMTLRKLSLVGRAPFGTKTDKCTPGYSLQTAGA